MADINEASIELSTRNRSVAQQIREAGHADGPTTITVNNHPLTEETTARIEIEVALGNGDTVQVPRHVRGAIHEGGGQDAFGRVLVEAEGEWRLDAVFHKTDLLQKFAEYALDPTKVTADPDSVTPIADTEVGRLRRNHVVLTDENERLRRKNAELERKLEQARAEHVKLFDSWQDALVHQK